MCLFVLTARLQWQGVLAGVGSSSVQCGGRQPGGAPHGCRPEACCGPRGSPCTPPPSGVTLPADMTGSAV